MYRLRGDQIIVRADRQPEPLKRSANVTRTISVVFVERDDVKRRQKVGQSLRVFFRARALGHPKPQLEKRDGGYSEPLSTLARDPGSITNNGRSSIDQRNASICIEENRQSSASRVCDFG